MLLKFFSLNHICDFDMTWMICVISCIHMLQLNHSSSAQLFNSSDCYSMHDFPYSNWIQARREWMPAARWRERVCCCSYKTSLQCPPPFPSLGMDVVMGRIVMHTPPMNELWWMAESCEKEKENMWTGKLSSRGKSYCEIGRRNGIFEREKKSKIKSTSELTFKLCIDF